MLANKHTYPYSRHIETVEEGLDIGVNLHSLPIPLVFQNTLSDSGNNAIVAPFDVLQGFRETLVVIVQLRRPVVAVIRGSIVAAGRGRTSAVTVGVRLTRGVLALLDTGILRCMAEDLGVLTIPLGRANQSLTYLRCEIRSGKAREFLVLRSDCDDSLEKATVLTSNDCAYQSCTFLIDGISFKWSGNCPSSCTRCANRIGSSSERN